MKARTLLVAVSLAATLALAASAFASISISNPRAAALLVKKMNTRAFGVVLATLSNRALYYFTPEKQHPGTIRCTGSCAKVWPVLYVPACASVAKKVPGFSGTFGTIRRPDGRRQLTYNRLPLYTYAHEGPKQVLCNNVNGWFVARV